MRERTYVKVTPTKVLTIDYTHFVGTCTSPTASDSSPIVNNLVEEEEVGLMHDVVTPQFAQLSRKGHIFNKPMDKLITITTDESIGFENHHRQKNWTYCSGTWKWLYSGYSYSGIGKASGLCQGKELSAPQIDTGTLISRALNKAGANVELSQASALESLGEGKETIQSLISIFGRLFKIIRKLKKLQFKDLLGELSPKELANRYMEVRYAIRPLMYECRNIVQALTYEVENDRKTFRGYESEKAYTEDERVDELSDGRLRYYKMRTDRVYEVRAGVLTLIKALNPLNLWGADQLLETAWELLPFSFIVDWFFDIGNAIAAWTPEMGVQPLASWYTTIDTVCQSVRVTGAGVSDCSHPVNTTCLQNEHTISDGEWCRKTITTIRTPVTNPAVMPTFKVKLNGYKLGDLAIICKKFFTNGR